MKRLPTFLIVGSWALLVAFLMWPIVKDWLPASVMSSVVTETPTSTPPAAKKLLFYQGLRHPENGGSWEVKAKTSVGAFEVDVVGLVYNEVTTAKALGLDWDKPESLKRIATAVGADVREEFYRILPRPDSLKPVEALLASQPYGEPPIWCCNPTPDTLVYVLAENRKMGGRLVCSVVIANGPASKLKEANDKGLADEMTAALKQTHEQTATIVAKNKL